MGGGKTKGVLPWVAFALLGSLALAPAAFGGAYPGANGKIAFMSDREPGRFQIFTMDPDGQAVRNVSNGTASDYGPEFSPDGTKIAFSRELPDPTDPGSTQLDLYVMNVDGSDQRRFTNTPSYEGFPTWSPDGKSLVFQRYPENELYVIEVDGTGDTRFTSATDVLRPAWSPDGGEIAYMREYCCTYYDIFAVDVAGGEPRNLTGHPGSGYDWAPSWSPDASRIAFARLTSSGWRTYVMRRDGSGQVQLPPSGLDYEFDPAWSPDGTKLAITGDGLEIYTMNADGTNPVRLTDNPAQDFQPDWQPLPSGPPDCTGAAASPATLSPPNGKLVTVTLSGATDPDGDPVTLTVTAVTQDEPTGGAPDAVLGPASNQVRLRAERDGGGDGRVYRIAFLASDGRGGTCTGTAKVSVQKGSHRAVDSPPSYNSLAP